MTLCPTCLHNYTRNMVPKQPVCCLHLDRGLSPGWPEHGGVIIGDPLTCAQTLCPRYKSEPKLSIVE